MPITSSNSAAVAQRLRDLAEGSARVIARHLMGGKSA